ncbi:hypothetical protein Tco_0317530 [Tanacetum coccineum]
MEDDKETVVLQSMMEVIPDEEEVAVDAIPLATKPPSIVDWKIIKEGKTGYYQIIRADGNSKRYSSMIQMLKSFDREDLETLWKLVKAKHGYTRPEEGYERCCWYKSYYCWCESYNCLKITTAGRVYADREEIKDLSEKR